MKIPRLPFITSLPGTLAAHTGTLAPNLAASSTLPATVERAIRPLQQRQQMQPNGPVLPLQALRARFGSGVERNRIAPRDRPSATNGAGPACRPLSSGSVPGNRFASRVIPVSWRWPACPRLQMQTEHTPQQWATQVAELKLKDFSIWEMQQWVIDFDNVMKPGREWSAAEFDHYYAYLIDGQVGDPRQRENYLQLRQAFYESIKAGTIGALVDPCRDMDAKP